MVERLGVKAAVRGRGLIWGVAFDGNATLTSQVSQTYFDAGIV
jgi:4-aminobutyrate aminotransferase-like enzyme